MFPLNDEKLVFNEDLKAVPQPDLRKYWEETREMFISAMNFRGCSSIESSFKPEDKRNTTRPSKKDEAYEHLQKIVAISP